MALPVSDTAQKEAQNHVETWVRSLFALHGYPAPGSDQLGGIVQQGMARISPDELRHPGAISTASLGQLDGLVRASVEVGKPQNIYGADAARAAQAAGADSARGGAGFGYIDAIRANSSARFRDLPSSDSNRRSGSAEAAAASGYASAESLNYVSAASFGRTPFAAAGMNYSTFAYVRGQDRALTGQNMLHAVDDAGKLGFGANDKEAIRDHAVIDHYSRDPRHANQSLQDYDHRKHDDAELAGWVAQAANEKDAAKRAELNKQIQERREQHRRESGVQEHIEHDHPKAGAAVRNRANRLDMRDAEGASKRLRHEAGHDAVRDSGFSDYRAAQSNTERSNTAKAERKQAALSEAKQDAARTADSLSLLAMAGDDAASPSATKPSSPAAEAAKPKTDKPSEPQKAGSAPEAGKADSKAATPEKPATPVRTRVAGTAGPSVG